MQKTAFQQTFNNIPDLMTGESTGVSTVSPASDAVVLLHLFRMLELKDKLKFKPIRPATELQSQPWDRVTITAMQQSYNHSHAEDSLHLMLQQSI